MAILPWDKKEDPTAPKPPDHTTSKQRAIMDYLGYDSNVRSDEVSLTSMIEKIVDKLMELENK